LHSSTHFLGWTRLRRFTRVEAVVAGCAEKRAMDDRKGAAESDTSGKARTKDHVVDVTGMESV